MYKIAQQYGVKLEQLIAFNPQISNPDQIDVGMKVKIPSAEMHNGHSSSANVHKHVVVQGDTLWKIAKAWGLPLKALVDANPQLKNPSVLLTGEIVNIPKQGSMANPGMNISPANPMNTVSMPNMVNNVSPANTISPPSHPIAVHPPENVERAESGSGPASGSDACCTH